MCLLKKIRNDIAEKYFTFIQMWTKVFKYKKNAKEILDYDVNFAPRDSISVIFLSCGTSWSRFEALFVHYSYIL